MCEMLFIQLTDDAWFMYGFENHLKKCCAFSMRGPWPSSRTTDLGSLHIPPFCYSTPSCVQASKSLTVRVERRIYNLLNPITIL